MDDEILLLKELRTSLLTEYFRDKTSINTSDSVSNIRKIASDSDIESLIAIINNCGFSELSNYDEMRALLYHYIKDQVVEQYYDENNKNVKLRKK